MQIELKYLECPHCKKWHARSELLSYSTHTNLLCWSDGKCEKEETLEYASLPYSKCTKCENFFWFEDCREIKDYEIQAHINPPKDNFKVKQIVAEFLKENLEDYQENKMDLNYPPAHWHGDNISAHLIEDFIAILKDTGDLPIDREIYIRTKLWQYMNDFVRNQSKGFLQIFKSKHDKDGYDEKMYNSYNKTRIDNLKHLSGLLQKVKGAEYENAEITIIEIERELGNFEQAKSLIGNLDPIDKQNNAGFVKKSLKMIEKKSAKVFIIK